MSFDYAIKDNSKYYQSQYAETKVDTSHKSKYVVQKGDNLLVNAPHTAEEIASEDWNHPYTRMRAAFPLQWVKERKFFPYVSKIDGGYGDRNLCCTCASLYEEK